MVSSLLLIIMASLASFELDWKLFQICKVTIEIAWLTNNISKIQEVVQGIARNQ